MVIDTRPPKLNLLRRTGSRVTGSTVLAAGGLRPDSFVVKAKLDYNSEKPRERPFPEDEADDVIDLGAPRLPRRPLPGQSPSRARQLHSYTPNPRLYPGPPKPKTKAEKVKRTEGRGRRSKRVFRRPVPNARLYRPAPPRPKPPPPSPWRGSWPPPAPTQPLATASIAALQLSEVRPEQNVRSQPSRRLVVTLPAQRNTMDPLNRTPEEGSDGNDTSSAPSEFLAEFLSAIMQRQYAEALKYCRLILQYEPHNATARGFYSLLQHKVAAPPAAAPPSPPTPSSPARRSPGYAVNLNDPAGLRLGSSSADSSPRRPHASPAPRRLRRLAVDVPVGSSHEGMEQEADESASSSSAAGAAGAGAGKRDVSRSRSISGSESDDSCASQSSLELDSSPSLSLSRRTDHTDRSGRVTSAGRGPSPSPGQSRTTPAPRSRRSSSTPRPVCRCPGTLTTPTERASGSGAGWESSGTPLSSRSGGGSGGTSGGTQLTDDNGNAPPSPEPKASLHADDMQNDNDSTSPLKSTSSSETLRRLRAHFACSIK